MLVEVNAPGPTRLIQSTTVPTPSTITEGVSFASSHTVRLATRQRGPPATKGHATTLVGTLHRADMYPKSCVAAASVIAPATTNSCREAFDIAESNPPGPMAAPRACTRAPVIVVLALRLATLAPFNQKSVRSPSKWLMPNMKRPVIGASQRVVVTGAPGSPLPPDQSESGPHRSPKSLGMNLEPLASLSLSGAASAATRYEGVREDDDTVSSDKEPTHMMKTEGGSARIVALGRSATFGVTAASAELERFTNGTPSVAKANDGASPVEGATNAPARGALLSQCTTDVFDGPDNVSDRASCASSHHSTSLPRKHPGPPASGSQPSSISHRCASSSMMPGISSSGKPSLTINKRSCARPVLYTRLLGSKSPSNDRDVVVPPSIRLAASS